MGGNVLKLRSEELIEQGLEQGIKGVILSEIQKNNSDVEIIAKLKDYFSLTKIFFGAGKPTTLVVG